MSQVSKCDIFHGIQDILKMSEDILKKTAKNTGEEAVEMNKVDELR